jgi:hypothetical protein
VSDVDSKAMRWVKGFLLGVGHRGPRISLVEPVGIVEPAE